MHRQPAREPPGGDSSIRPEQLLYAVGQLERLGPLTAVTAVAASAADSTFTLAGNVSVTANVQ